MKRFISNIIILLLASTAVLSCSLNMDIINDMTNADRDTYMLVVTGTASDLNTGEPIEEIKISLHAAEHGGSGEGTLVSKTTYTDNSGRFSISAEGFKSETTCLITAEDPNGKYNKASQEINITWSNINMVDGTFYVNDCSFYLEKK